MAIYNVKRLAAETGWDIHTIYGYAGRDEDPLPLRYVEGRKRRGIIKEESFWEWFDRNSVAYAERS